jgi:hypothetical protein
MTARGLNSLLDSRACSACFVVGQQQQGSCLTRILSNDCHLLRISRVGHVSNGLSNSSGSSHSSHLSHPWFQDVSIQPDLCIYPNYHCSSRLRPEPSTCSSPLESAHGSTRRFSEAMPPRRSSATSLRGDLNIIKN